jgi:ABC-type multidrug transport system ATPase subunit
MTSVHSITGRVRIGRSADNDIVLSDLTASRHHAELIGNPQSGYELIDLGSHNGTFVNGRHIDRQAITEKDLIAIGQYVCRLQDGSLELFAQQGEIGFDVVGLVVKAGNKTLLQDVSFSLPKRSLLAAVGPSGAGKSTLLGALNGLRPAHEGHVYYGGRDLYLAYDELRHRIGYVPQDDILHPTLTVRRALTYAAELRFGPDVSRVERDRRVDEVMEELELVERADLQTNRLSGGQRKRVSIAMELLTRPNILFLDEPTSGLDPGMEKHVMELLRQLANGDRTVIVVTHSVQSLHVCDRLLFLAHGGQVAFYGPPQEALGFFDHDNFADVFADLQNTELDNWRQKLSEKGIYERYIRRPLAERKIQSQGIQASESEGGVKPQKRWRQFKTLTRRYLELIASDPVNLLLLSCQAPLLAVIVLLATGSSGFDTSNSSALNTALLSALLIAVSATYLGASNSIREIVKELPLYSRERAVGLSIASYIASKVAVLSVITIIQGIVLVMIGTIRQGGPSGGVVVPWLRLELIVAVALTGMGAMGIGLVISALVSKADKALTLLPLVLVPQLILAYPNLKVQDKPVLNQLSYVAPTQWGYAAFSSSIHFNQIIYMKAASLDPTIPRIADADKASGDLIKQVDSRTDLKLLPRWDHEREAWFADIAAMLGLLVLEVITTGLILRRRDPELLRRRSRRLRARRLRIAERSAPSQAG